MLYMKPLTPEEQSQVDRVDRVARSSDTVTYRRAQIVRLSARQTPVGTIAKALNVSERTVRNTIHAFPQKGLTALPRKKSPGRRRSLTPEQREKLIELLHPSPTLFGIESALWLRDRERPLASGSRAPSGRLPIWPGSLWRRGSAARSTPIPCGRR